jgi:hypothetical protein
VCAWGATGRRTSEVLSTERLLLLTTVRRLLRVEVRDVAESAKVTEYAKIVTTSTYAR